MMQKNEYVNMCACVYKCMHVNIPVERENKDKNKPNVENVNILCGMSFNFSVYLKIYKLLKETKLLLVDHKTKRNCSRPPMSRCLW